MDYHAMRLLQALTNCVLAMNGEPPPMETTSTAEISERLDLIARRLRLDH